MRLNMSSRGNTPTDPVRNGSMARPKDEKRADAHTHGDEQGDVTDGFRADVLKEKDVAGFMVQVSSRLRSIQPPQLRAEKRSVFFDLLKGLSVDVAAQPPYSLAAADRLRDFLEEAGLGEGLLLDFEMILGAVEDEAQRRKESAEKVAEALEQERRRKGEWDVIEKGDVDEQWEMV